MLAKAISKGAFAAGVWNMARIGSSALSAFVLARLLGVESYGQYVYYLAIMMLVPPFVNLGTSVALTKYIAEAPQDTRQRHQLAILLALVNSLGIVCLGIITWFILSRSIVEGSSIPLLLIVAGAIIFEQGWLFARGVLYGLRHEALATLPAAAGFIMGAILSIALAWLGLGLPGVLGGLLISKIVVAIVTFRYASQFLTWDWEGNLFKVLPTRSIIYFGLSSMLLQVLNTALYRADVLLIQHLAGPSQAGLYGVAVQWSELVWFVPVAVQSILIQSMAQLWLDDRRIGDITALLSRLLRYVALGTAFLLTLIFVFGGQLLYLFFGPDFVAATPALRLLIPGVFSFSLARLMWPVIQARGQVLPLVLVSAVATMTNLGLNWVLMPTWGAIGAALASCLTYGSVIFAYAWILEKWGVQPLRGLRGGRLLLLCMVTMVILAPVAMLVTSALMAVIIGGLLGVVVYSLGALWLGLVMVAELQQIIDSLPDFLGRPGAKIFKLLQPMLSWVEVSQRAEP